MVSRYSIIQYVPNPVADERINIGVLAFDDDSVLVRFLSSWTRVSCFGKHSEVPTLKEFARKMKETAKAGLLFPGDDTNGKRRHERLLKVSNSWLNSIQFTEPRGSLETVDILLEEVAQNYLLETEHPSHLRDRQVAARITTSHIRNLLKQRFGPEKAQELLRTDYKLRGNYKPHKFDVTVARTNPFFAAHAISFEVKTTEKVVDSLAWMISDVKGHSPNFPLAVVMLPPPGNTPNRQQLERLYKTTVHTYQDLGAKVLEEHQVDSWVSGQLEAVKL